MLNSVTIQGIIQPGYQGKPAIYQLETNSGLFLTKFTIKHTAAGRSMTVNVVRWGTSAPTLQLSDGMEVVITGKLSLDSYEKDGVKQYRLAVVPESIKILGDKEQVLQATPTLQPTTAPQQQQSQQPGFDHDIPPLPGQEDSGEHIPF